MAQSTKQKLDQLLGISEDQTIDDFLSDLETNTDKVSGVLSSIDNEVKQSLTKVDDNLNKLSCHNVGEVDMLTTSQVEDGLNEIRSLIDTSKRVIQQVYESICTTDLIDSELIQAFAKLIEATHVNIADYIDLYKQRVQYYDKIKLLAFDHQNRIERMRIKQQLDIETAKAKNTNVVPEGMVSFDYDDIQKMAADATLVND